MMRTDLDVVAINRVDNGRVRALTIRPVNLDDIACRKRSAFREEHRFLTALARSDVGQHVDFGIELDQVRRRAGARLLHPYETATPREFGKIGIDIGVRFDLAFVEITNVLAKFVE